MAGVDATIGLPSIEALVLQLHGRTRALTPNEEDVVDRYAGEVRDYVVARWPVDTGTSADAWQYEVDVSPGSYGFTVLNDIDYAEWVHYAGSPTTDEAGVSLGETLIEEGWLAVRSALLTELETEVRATEALMATRGRRSLYTTPIKLARAVAA